MYQGHLIMGFLNICFWVGIAGPILASNQESSQKSVSTIARQVAAECYLVPHKDIQSKNVEFFLKKPTGLKPYKTVVLVHGHQQSPNIQGGKVFVEDETLQRLAKEGYLAVAVSQPGYGGSEGPTDWCGPYTQNALITVLEYLRAKGLSQKDKIVLMGVSRGAVVAGMVLSQDNGLAGAVLESNFYNLADVTDPRTVTNLGKETDSSEKSLKERSIAHKIKAINAPILILHGYHDPRAPIGSTLAFYHNLMAAQKEAMLILFPTGHHVPDEARWTYVLKFLKDTLVGKEIENG